MAGNSHRQHIVFFNLTPEFNVNDGMTRDEIFESWVNWYGSCFSVWFHQTVDHPCAYFSSFRLKAHEASPKRFLDSPIEHICDFTLKGSNMSIWFNMFIPILSLMCCYENGWYSMAMLDYLRLNRVDHVKVHTHQMFAPLRKWRGDKKISSSGMSSAQCLSHDREMTISDGKCFS